jgi:hypothetical protein
MPSARPAGWRMRSSAAGGDSARVPWPRTRIERERAERTVSRAKGQGFGLFSAVKHSLSGMMDVDPEATRRANIGKTRDNISQVNTVPNLGHDILRTSRG